MRCTWCKGLALVCIFRLSIIEGSGRGDASIAMVIFTGYLEAIHLKLPDLGTFPAASL